MRIYVNVPQAYLSDMKPGLEATLEVPGKEQRHSRRHWSPHRTQSRKTREQALVELQAANPDGKLWPGAFTEVHFHIPSDPNTLRIPATALVFGPHGMSVAAMDADDKVELKKVHVGPQSWRHRRGPLRAESSRTGSSTARRKSIASGDVVRRRRRQRRRCAGQQGDEEASRSAGRACETPAWQDGRPVAERL